MSSLKVHSLAPDIPGYSLGAMIGEGHTGNVYLATKTSSKTKSRSRNRVAVKVFHGENAHREFAVESRILQALQGHPNVACMFTSMLLDSPECPAAIVFAHYAGGSLLKRLESPRPVIDGEARIITSDVLQALRHIHSREVIHRDVKPENICVDSDGRSVLIDFDIACHESDQVARAKRCGTLGFMAPEILGGKTVRRFVDLFSLGALLYFLFQRSHPFTGKLMTEDSIAFRTQMGVYNFGPLFDDVNASCKELISSLLRVDARERPSAEEALQHHWFVVDAAVFPPMPHVMPDLDLPSPSVDATITPPWTPTSAADAGGKFFDGSPPSSPRTPKTRLRDFLVNFVGAPQVEVDAAVSPASAHVVPELDLPSQSDDATTSLPCTPTSAAVSGGNVSEVSPPSSPQPSKTRFRNLRLNFVGAPGWVTDANLSPTSTCATKDVDFPSSPTSAAESSGNVFELSPPSSPTSSATSSPRFRDVYRTFVGSSPRMSHFPRKLRQFCFEAARVSDVSTGTKDVCEEDNEEVFDTGLPCQVEPSSPGLRLEPPKKTNVSSMLRNSFRKRSAKGQAVIVEKSNFEADAQVVCSVP